MSVLKGRHIGALLALLCAAGCQVRNQASYTLIWGPVTVPPGTERTQCVVKRLDNLAPLQVGSFHNRLTASHHLLLYRVGDTAERPEPYDCQPFTDTLAPDKGAPILITQIEEETLTLPPGVAYTLAPRQMIRIELHYVNATPAPVQVGASTTFAAAPEGTVKDEAELLLIGNTDLHIPARSTLTLGPTFMPLVPALAGARFFGLTGHTHRWGTRVTISARRDPGGADVSLYDVPDWRWSEPAFVHPDPPFQIDEGGGFRFRCDYDNQSDRPVKFGESIDDEMCFFWAYYYPSKGARVCIHSGVLGRDLCCPEDALCDALTGD
jgi:hypothetical protein